MNRAAPTTLAFIQDSQFALAHYSHVLASTRPQDEPWVERWQSSEYNTVFMREACSTRIATYWNENQLVSAFCCLIWRPCQVLVLSIVFCRRKGARRVVCQDGLVLHVGEPFELAPEAAASLRLRNADHWMFQGWM